VNAATDPEIAILTGGGDRPYALGLAASLRAEGVRFEFIGSDDLESPELQSDPNVRFLNLRGDMRPEASPLAKVLRIAKYYVRLVAYAATARPKVFHILWNNKLEWCDRTLLLAYYKLLGKRLVFTVHNVNIRERDGNDSALNRFTLGVQYRLVDHLFVHTQKMAAELTRSFGVPAEKISVIPFGINGTVPDTALTPAEARSCLGLGSKDKVLLFFGNIARYKGLEFLVEALPTVLEAHPETRLIVAGRPKGAETYWRAIEDRIAALGMEARVMKRIEYVPDAQTEVYFKAADVLVLPYTDVFQSGVLFLGYNFGLPAIAADVGALREEIVEGETGFVCAPVDASALAAAIDRFFTSILFRELAARRASIRAYAAEQHSWAKVAAISRRVYASCSP